VSKTVKDVWNQTQSYQTEMEDGRGILVDSSVAGAVMLAQKLNGLILMAIRKLMLFVMTLKETIGLNFPEVMVNSREISANTWVDGAVIQDPILNGPILMVMEKLILFVMIQREITGLSFPEVMENSQRISVNSLQDGVVI
jgi:hypothetical protein